MGGKKALRNTVYELSPASFERYIEVFGGGGWVLFGRPPDPKVMEVYNDFNSNLTNLYACVKNHTMEFLRQLGFLPLNGRDEFLVLRRFLEGQEFAGTFLAQELELARHNLPPLEFEELRSLFLERAEPGDVQRAAAFYKVIRYSYGSGCTSFGCQPFDVRKTFHQIWQAADRLANTVIENKDFEALIRQYDRENAFLYCDPPYFMTEDHYEVEFPRQNHVRLRETLAGCQGKWMVSYNDCDYIRGLYEGCHITAVSRINNLAQRYDRGCEFPEVIITNYDPQERKKWGPQQMNLFSAGLLGGETEDGRN